MFDLVLGPWGFLSNKPTHYLLDYEDYLDSNGKSYYRGVKKGTKI